MPRRPRVEDPFARVRTIGLALADVVAEPRYDGAPALKVRECFMAALASHRSAEPDSLVVRIAPDDRARFIEDAPDVYYVTDYYERHPVVLVRLARVSDAALQDLLAISRRLTLLKGRREGRQSSVRLNKVPGPEG